MFRKRREAARDITALSRAVQESLGGNDTNVWNRWSCGRQILIKGPFATYK